VTTARCLRVATLVVLAGLGLLGGGVSATEAGVLEITTSTAAPALAGGQVAMDQAVRAAVDALLARPWGSRRP
jgi:hypothetical protein